MFNEYARLQTLERIAEEFSEHRLPVFSWRDGQTANDLDRKASVCIGDAPLTVRLSPGGLVGEMA